MHTWKTGGSFGRSVAHSSRENGEGCDAAGVGQDHAVIGPFTSGASSRTVADALNQAYELGKLDGSARLLERQAHDAPPVTSEDMREILRAAYQAADGPSEDAEHDALLRLMDELAAAFSIDSSTYETSAPSQQDADEEAVADEVYHRNGS
jgi:hypothetical protein